MLTLKEECSTVLPREGKTCVNVMDNIKIIIQQQTNTFNKPKVKC